MSKSKTPVKAVKKTVTKVKAKVARKKTQSAKAAKALTGRVRQAMPKKAAAPQKKTAAKPKARKPVKKDISLLSTLKEGLEIIGNTVLLPVRKVRGQR